jgi:glutamate-1-semialdehyde 2,1-aminomutase
MAALAPAGPVYQAGTLSGNPLAMAAGSATLGALDADAWSRLETTSAQVVEILCREAARAGVALQASCVGGMFGFFFAEHPVTDWEGAAACQPARFAQFFHAMLREGVYLAPSPFEAGFVSTVHGDRELDHFAGAARAAMAQVAML